MNFRVWAGASAALLLASCQPTPPPAPAHTAETAGVVDGYRTWALAQADSFLTATAAFTAAVEAGDRAKAQTLYAPARMFYERIEPVAEALGDLDPRIDAREGDVADTEWGGYHKLEKALWSNADLKASRPVAQTLLADVKLLRAKIETATLTVPAMVTGAVELLNEVSATKVTGEEERYSRTDLYDFQANVEGAEQIWTLLHPAVGKTDPELAKKIDDRFATLHGLLDVHRKGEGFRSYTDVPAPDVKALAAAVDALAEPLAQLGTHFPSE